jgi:hypothetical protein
VLRQRKGCSRFSRAQVGQPTFTLSLGPKSQDHRAHDEVAVQDTTQRHKPARDFLDQPGIRDVVKTEPPVLLRDHAAEQPKGLHLVDHGFRKLVGQFECRCIRNDLVIYPAGDGLNDLVGDV